ncbi:MAG: transcription termination factor NusA [Acidobacteria bacterium]|jgi:N utilization substance protein A|nr:transcription termination factor NusA [Acidobacteriota bacterium]
MPAVTRSEFALALNQVATERGINKDVVLDSIKAAILAAYRKDYVSKEEQELTVDIDSDTGEAKIFHGKKNITPAGFGRIAAQTAKQVILQKIREAEKAAIISDYSTKIGSVVAGMVLRFDNSNIIIDIGRAQGVMIPSEQVRNERYYLNQRLSFYIVDIRETYRGNEIIVSRAHKGLVEGLFRREVPEIANGSVEIKGIAREAGARTKISVNSTQPGVDPIGSCVGQKGVRVQTIITELGGIERIDIIQWNEEPKQYIVQALSPAKDINIVLEEKTKSALVYVSDDQLSLAIGREGQNVRLAAKLTGWKIDIKSNQEKEVKVNKEKKAEKEDNKTNSGTKEVKKETKKELKENKASKVKKE